MLQKTKSLLTKCLAFLFIVCCVVAATVGLVACNNEVTIASIKVANGKLSVEYSDGKTENFDLVVPETKCDHAETNDVSILNGCELKTLHICVKCGAVANVTSEESHDYVHNYDVKTGKSISILPRVSCLLGARNADVCTRCGKETNVEIINDSLGGNLEAHGEIKTVIYKLDPGHESDFCVCEAQTVTADICTVCGVTLEVKDVVPAPGHKFGDWKITEEPTDTEVGVMERVCTVCNNKHVDTKDARVYAEIPALKVLNDKGEATLDINPKYTYVKGEGASCAKGGRKDAYTFTDPEGKEQKIEVTVTTDHYLVVDNTAKYIKAGDVCVNADYADKIEAFDDITCKEAGVEGFFTCDECDKKVKVKVRNNHAAYNEKEDEVVSTKPATCTEVGTIVYKCGVCGEEAKTEVAALGHKLVLDTNGIVKPEGEATEWTFKVHCGRGGCDYTATLKGAEPTIKEEAATCTEDAATVYTNITVKDGDKDVVLMDGDKVLEIRDVKAGTALGHHNAVLDTVVKPGTAFDIRVGKNAEAFEAFDDVDCLTHSTAAKTVEGFYTCDREGCGKHVKVALYKSHTGKVTPVDYETCTKEGTYSIEKCDDCGSVGEEKVPALGHEWVYTCKTVKGEVVVTRVCVRENKFLNKTTVDEKEVVTTTTKVCGTVETVEGVKSYNIDTAATCASTGLVTITYTGESKKAEQVVLAKSGHTLNGEEMILADADEKHFYDYDLEGVELTVDESEITCDEDKLDALTSANAMFRCDTCKKARQIFVKKDHVKKTDGAEHKDATCEEVGYDNYDCEKCGKHFDNEIEALGHVVVVKLADDHKSIALTCKREGCKYAKEALNVNLPEFDVKAVLTSVNGEIVVKDSADYTVETITKGTCTVPGRYKVTLKAAAYERILGNHAEFFYNENTVISYEIVMNAEHATDSKLVTWTYNGDVYTGSLCTVCGNMVIKTINGVIVK